MLASKDYGTLEATADTKRSSKRVVMIVAGVIACAVVATVTFGAGYAQVNSTVNANLGRAAVSPISDRLGEKFEALCMQDSTERFVTSAVINGQVDVTSVGFKDGHWKGSVDHFIQLLAESEAVSEENVAFGMVDLPVYEDSSRTSYVTRPTFVTYIGDDVGAEDFVAGTYLGSALLKAKCAADVVVLNSRDNYKTLCEKTEAKQYQCDLVEGVECPWTDVDGNSPCSSAACSDVASYAVGGRLSPACCDEIDAFCVESPESEGCTGYALEEIYQSKCVFAPENANDNDTQYFHENMGPQELADDAQEDEVALEVAIE